MKVNEFIKEYEAIKLNNTMLDRLIESLKEEDSYVPYIEKVTLAQRIATATMINQETGMIRLNTPIKFIMSTMQLLYRITKLEPSSDESIVMYSDYDLLNKYKLIEVISAKLDLVPEYEEFNTILAMTCDDIMQNKYESHIFATEMIGMITNGITKALEPLSPTLEKFLNMDDEQIEKMNEKLGKAIDKISK